MSDLRFDPIANLWVAIARNRQERPMEFVPIEHIRQQLMCPFCIGNEDETPLASAIYRRDGTQFGENEDATLWSTRVIPNKYPSFGECGKPVEKKPVEKKPVEKRPVEKKRAANGTHGPYESSCLPGEQELIIPTPRHVTSLSELHDDELLVSFAAYQDRVRYFQSLDHVRHTMLFTNCRSTAGASLSHLHTQLIGSPVVSDRQQGRWRRNEEYFQQHGQSLIQAMAAWEVQQRHRMIFQSDHFDVFCPFASRFAFQIWIVPKHHQRQFVDAPREMRDELARNCRWLISQVEELLEHPGYNLLLHQAPVKQNEQDHWYFEILPRLTFAAGFEWGTDIWINPVSPESAAKRLRLK